MLTYLIVPVCLIVLSNAARTWPNARKVATTGIICGLTAIIFVALLTINIHSPYAGLYQRIVEGSILLFIVITANYLQKEGNPGRR
jgi:amino acid transporter